MDAVMSQPLSAAAVAHGWEAYRAAARSAPSQPGVRQADASPAKTAQEAQDADRNS